MWLSIGKADILCKIKKIKELCVGVLLVGRTSKPVDWRRDYKKGQFPDEN